MDGIFAFLIVSAILIVLFIIAPGFNRQKRRAQYYRLASGDIQPIFLLRSVEKKLSTLADILYADKTLWYINNTMYPDKFRQLLIRNLELLETEYNNKRITLGEYDNKLLELLNQANRYFFSNRGIQTLPQIN